MKRLLIGLIIGLLTLVAPAHAQRQDIRQLIERHFPGSRLATEADYYSAEGGPLTSLKDEGGQVLVSKDFDLDSRRDWAAIIIDPATKKGRACLFMNLGSSYKALVLWEWEWNGEHFMTFHLRPTRKHDPQQHAERRFAHLVSDKPLEEFSAAEKKLLQNKIKRYSVTSSLNLVQWYDCPRCVLFSGAEHFFDAGRLQVVYWAH